MGGLAVARSRTLSSPGAGSTSLNCLHVFPTLGSVIALYQLAPVPHACRVRSDLSALAVYGEDDGHAAGDGEGAPTTGLIAIWNPVQ